MTKDSKTYIVNDQATPFGPTPSILRPTSKPLRICAKAGDKLWMNSGKTITTAKILVV